MLGGQDFDPFGDEPDEDYGLIHQMERQPHQNVRAEISRPQIRLEQKMQQVRQPLGPKVINTKSPSPIKISNESPSMYMTPDSDNFVEGENLDDLVELPPPDT